MVGIVLVVSLVNDVSYLVRLQLLDGRSEVAEAHIVTPSNYVPDAGQRQFRDMLYVFDLGETRYEGVISDDGTSTGILKVRYVPDNPSINIPVRVDIASERGFALLRVIAVLAVAGVSIVVVRALRRASNAQPPLNQGPMTPRRPF